MTESRVLCNKYASRYRPNLDWGLIFISLFIASDVHAKQPKLDVVGVLTHANSGWSSENHSKAQYVTFLEDIPIGALAINIKSMTGIVNPSKINLFPIQRMGYGYLMPSRPNDSIGLGKVCGRSFQGADERVLSKDGINPGTNFIGRGLPRVFNLDLPLDLTVSSKIQPRLRYAQVGSKLSPGSITGYSDSIFSSFSSSGRLLGLLLNSSEGASGYDYTPNQKPGEYQSKEPRDFIVPSPFRQGSRIGDVYGGLLMIVGAAIAFGFEAIATAILCRNRRSSWGWICACVSGLAFVFTVVNVLIGCLPGSCRKCACDGEGHSKYRQSFQHNSAIVPLTTSKARLRSEHRMGFKLRYYRLLGSYAGLARWPSHRTGSKHNPTKP
jgi:hypothetical protein